MSSVGRLKTVLVNVLEDYKINVLKTAYLFWEDYIVNVLKTIYLLLDDCISQCVGMYVYLWCVCLTFETLPLVLTS